MAGSHKDPQAMSRQAAGYSIMRSGGTFAQQASRDHTTTATRTPSVRG